MKYKRIEKKLDTIIQLLETIVSRLPKEAALEEAAAKESALLEASPFAPALTEETQRTRRDPLELIEDKEEWRKVIGGWKEPASFSQSHK